MSPDLQRVLFWDLVVQFTTGILLTTGHSLEKGEALVESKRVLYMEEIGLTGRK